MILEAIAATIISISPAYGAASAIPEHWGPVATCVSARESHHNYRARNPHSSAEGRWQFLDRSWRHGLAHMVAKRLHDYGLPWSKAKQHRQQLRTIRIQKWPAWAQDAGFAAVIDTPNGWTHWRLPGSRCNVLAVRH